MLVTALSMHVNGLGIHASTHGNKAWLAARAHGRCRLKTDGNIPVPISSIFYFCPSVFVFMGSYFCIYGSRNEVSPSVSEESRFYMELTRIYSVFNLHKICLKIDMFKNIPITKYAC